MGRFIAVPAEDEYGIEEIRGKTLDSGKEKIDKYFKKYKRMKLFILSLNTLFILNKRQPETQHKELLTTLKYL